MANQEEQEKSPETKDIPGLSVTEQTALVESGTGTDAALLEARQLSSGRSAKELEQEAAENEHGRTESFRDLFDKLVRIGMMLAFAGIIFTGGVWVWHLIAPTSWQWLTDSELDRIQNLVTGGVLAVVVGDHFKRRLG